MGFGREGKRLGKILEEILKSVCTLINSVGPHVLSLNFGKESVLQSAFIRKIWKRMFLNETNKQTNQEKTKQNSKKNHNKN